MKIIKWIIKELVLKIDFEKNEFECGYVWLSLIIIKLIFII